MKRRNPNLRSVILEAGATQVQSIPKINLTDDLHHSLCLFLIESSTRLHPNIYQSKKLAGGLVIKTVHKFLERLLTQAIQA